MQTFMPQISLSKRLSKLAVINIHAGFHIFIQLSSKSELLILVKLPNIRLHKYQFGDADLLNARCGQLDELREQRFKSSLSKTHVLTALLYLMSFFRSSNYIKLD
jgi:hypothetical protein